MLRSLDAQEIVKTSARLQQRIAERFPNSNLSGVAAELHQISQESMQRSARICRPNLVLRIVIGLLLCGIAALLTASIASLRRSGDVLELLNFVQFLESSLGSLVLISAAIAFLVSLEIRFKRARALRALHELRAVAHIIDMHQMTKDPEKIIRGPTTPSSPVRTMTSFQLCRYLDYCTELLSIISKIGALYVQDFPDPVAMESVDQVENMTNGLSRKIWQKIMILDLVVDDASRSHSGPAPEIPALPQAESAPAAPAAEPGRG